MFVGGKGRGKVKHTGMSMHMHTLVALNIFGCNPCCG